MIKYRVTNLLEQTVSCGALVFGPKETKILDKIPGDGFHIEQVEETEKVNKSKGGK